MQIEITKEVDTKLKKISSVSGLDRKKIVTKAIDYYLLVLDQELKLKSKFNSLDKLSDEALLNFEENL
jgi:hypothetical protein